MRKLIILILTVAITGCSTLVDSLVYPMIEKSDVPNVGVEYQSESNSLLWDFNSHLSSNEKSFDQYSWNVVHSGSSSDWEWILYSTKEANQGSLSTSIAEDWDTNLASLATHSRHLLSDSGPVKLNIYLLPEEKFHLTYQQHIDKTVEVPIFLGVEEIKGNSLPENINDKVDLLAEVGEQVQLAYYELGKIPSPKSATAAFLKKYANANCWRVAIRPALVMGSDQHIKRPPTMAGSVMRSFKGVFESNPNDIKVAQLYSAGLLLNDVEEHLAEVDLDWPATGRDELEINALLNFCETYLKNGKDPRT
ncbi:hypothetical protein ACR0ST_05770 [Aliidiomarina sp. Khilg15.8]